MAPLKRTGRRFELIAHPRELLRRGAETGSLDHGELGLQSADRAPFATSSLLKRG